MLKKVKCPSCGASLKPDSYYCDYCGAFFEKENALEQEQLRRFETQVKVEQKTEVEEDLYKKDNFVSTEEIENSRLNSILIQYANIKESNPYLNFVWIVLFFLVFMTGAVFETPFSTIFFIIILSSIVNAQKERKKELIRLYEKGAYLKAYKKITETKLNQEQINIIKQKIMLCYYRLDKKEEAKILIQNLNNKIHNKDEHIKEVAEKLGVIYSPKSV